MNFATVGLIVGTVWISLVIVAIAICRAARRADVHHERYHVAMH
jgi:hypothetical protein